MYYLAAVPVCAKKLAQRSPSPIQPARKVAQRSPSSSTSAKKLAQQAQKHQNWGVFSALGELFRARTHIKPRGANFFAHRTRRHGDVETNDTTAATIAGHRKTPITTARPSTAAIETDNTSAIEKRTKNTHVRPAKATPVSTGPPHRPAKAMPVSVEARPARAKATAVSRDRSATPARSHGHTPQKTRMQFDWMKFQRSLKTLQFRRSDFRI